jgi:hypothetical protein
MRFFFSGTRIRNGGLGFVCCFGELVSNNAWRVEWATRSLRHMMPPRGDQMTCINCCVVQCRSYQLFCRSSSTRTAHIRKVLSRTRLAWWSRWCAPLYFLFDTHFGRRCDGLQQTIWNRRLHYNQWDCVCQRRCRSGVVVSSLWQASCVWPVCGV